MGSSAYRAVSAPLPLSISFTADCHMFMATEGVVVIKLGPKGIDYHVHKALLVHHSEYFRNALTGRWKESEEQAITLADVEPDACTYVPSWRSPDVFTIAHRR